VEVEFTPPLATEVIHFEEGVPEEEEFSIDFTTSRTMERMASREISSSLEVAMWGGRGRSVKWGLIREGEEM
jgi:hypothetical protein